MAVFGSFICAYNAIGGHWGWAALSGLLIAITVLIRPIALYLFIPVTILLTLRSKRRLAATLAITIAACGPMMLWAYRNYRSVGVATISSITGEAVLFCRAAGVLVVEEKGPLFGTTAFQRQTGYTAAADRLRPALLQRALDRMRADGLDPLAVPHARRASYFGNEGARIIAARPLAFVALATSSLISMFLDSYWLVAAERGTHFRDAQTMFIPSAALIFLVALLGLASLRRQHRNLFFLLLIYVLYFTGTAAAVGPGEYRMIVPFGPLYALSFGFGVSWLLDRTKAGPENLEDRPLPALHEPHS